jgi:hypothetical protein
MYHKSERPVPLILDVKYTEKNYMQRRVVKAQELENLKGGDVIDFLSKPYYAGG